MSGAPLITSDAHCHKCRYNLRGLQFDGRCPECGEPIANSLRLTVRLPVPGDATESATRRELIARLHKAAEISGYPGDSVMLVFLALQYAGHRDGPRDRAAPDICAAVRDYTKFAFGGESGAILELATRKIHDSEDVGHIVFAMVAAGLYHAGESDRIEDFRDLFTLEDLFTRAL